MREQFLKELKDIVGIANVLTSGDLSAYEKAWRGPYKGIAGAVVRPASTSEVAAVVTACVREGVTIVPQGGNTGLVAGSIPDSSGLQIVLQLGRMNSIRRIDPDNLTVTVEAGCVLETLQTQVRQAGFLFPLSLAAEGSCMIGGNLATNAGGTQVLRYGTTRDLCLGLEVVTPNGSVLNGLSGLRKDNTGYDLRDIFIGSEGTLGIITAATLKLYPLPEVVLTSWATLDTLEGAIKLLNLARRRLDVGLTGFEMMDAAALGLIERHIPQLRIPFGNALPPFSILIEYSSMETQQAARERVESFLGEALEQQIATDVAFAESDAHARQMWEVREHIAMAQAKQGVCVANDISIPISRIPEFSDSAVRSLAAAFPGVWTINLGHLGDGNLHFNIQAPINTDASVYMQQHGAAIAEHFFQIVAAYDGSISAEHGIGTTKVASLASLKDPTALQLMRAIKDAIDPCNLMNPGRVLANKTFQPTN